MKNYSLGVVMVGVLVAFALLGVAPSAFAQVPTIVSTKVDVVRLSAPTVIVASVTVQAASFTCNLLPAPLPPVIINPVNVEYTDVAASTPTSPKVCRASISATLAALPPADYTGTATFVYSDAGVIGGVSLASNPFTRFDSTAPLGLRIVR